MYNDLCNIRTFKVNHAERHEGSRKLKSHSAITLAVGRAEVLPDVSPWGAGATSWTLSDPAVSPSSHWCELVLGH